MMMRYLGVGIGHCQAAVFPRKINDLPETLARNFNYKPIAYDGEELVPIDVEEEEVFDSEEENDTF